MNRLKRLVGLLAARPTGAHDDRSAQRRRCPRRSHGVRGGVHRPDVSQRVGPRLAYGGGVQGFFVGHRGYHYASTALMDPMTKAFVADIHGFVAARGLELVCFAKERKDDLAQQFLARFTGTEGVLFVGRAQEKAGVWRTQRRYNRDRGLIRLAGPLDGVHQLLLLLLRGRRLRPVLPQVQHLLPLHRQAVHQRQRVGQTPGREGRDRVHALDNGFAAVDDVAAVQAICDSLGPAQIDALLRKWLAILPNPFTAEDETAGYRYELSVLQAEFSLTQMLDRRCPGGSSSSRSCTTTSTSAAPTRSA